MDSFSLRNDANLKGYWKLEGNATDEKGSYNGTATSLTYGSSYGKFNQGIITNARPSGMVISPTMVGTIGTGEFGISLWFNPKAPETGKWGTLFVSSELNSPYTGPSIVFDPLNSLSQGNGILFRTTTTPAHTVVSPSASSLYNIWTNIVFTRLSGVSYAYYNGVEKTHWTDTVNIAASTECSFGGRPVTQPNECWSGSPNTCMMDDVAYLNRGITAGEALGIYNQGIYILGKGLFTFIW